MDDVTLKLKVEVTRLGDQIILQSSPEIKQFKFGTRTAETSLMLKDDETVVLAGLIQNEDRKTKTTVPWLGDLPLIGHLFSSTTVDSVTTEVVLTITPHILRGQSTATLAAQGFWSGTESTFATHPLYYSQPVSFSAPPMASPASHVTPFSPSERGSDLSGAPMPLMPPGLTGMPPVPLLTPSASEPPPGGELIARAPTAITFQTGETAAAVNQEFSVGLITPQPELINEGQLQVMFDPTRLEFRRAESGSALVSAQVEEGIVLLHLNAPGQAVPPGSALVTLVFQGTVPGASTITLEPVEHGVGGETVSPTTTQRLRVLVR
jgi:general secretion pathway protein D